MEIYLKPFERSKGCAKNLFCLKNLKFYYFKKLNIDGRNVFGVHASDIPKINIVLIFPLILSFFHVK